MADTTTVSMSAERRDELRRYKADQGITYDTAVKQLLDEAGWYDE